MKKQLFLILGAPGSGKTTDAKEATKRNHEDFVSLSTGDILREISKNGGEIGEKIDFFINQGKLVPLDIVVSSIKDAISKSSKNTILLDGYPRSLEQAQALKRVLKKSEDLDLNCVVVISVSKEVAKSRVLGRSRGVDDKEDVFNHRMEIYNNSIDDIMEFYKINGELTSCLLYTSPSPRDRG